MSTAYLRFSEDYKPKEVKMNYLIEVTNRQTGEVARINFFEDMQQTQSMRIRTGQLNGTLFLTNRGNGANGAGDICPLDVETLEVNGGTFDRIIIFAKKNNAIVSRRTSINLA